jgi:hypothetical protein
MKLKIVLICAILIGVLACSKSNDDVEEPAVIEEKKPKKALVIGIDGCMPSGITASNTPNLDALMANGTFSLGARNTRTTSSGPAWSSILTGVWEEKHGVTNNAFTGSNFSKYPHFFKRVKDVYPSSRNVSVCEWSPINEHVAKLEADIVRSSNNAADTESKAIAELGVKNLTSLFLHFDAPDHAGHSTGFSAENAHYIEAIEEVDTAIGGVIQAMKSRENYIKEDWMVIVTTDHGGIGTGHGGDSEEERTIFMIVSGDNIPNKEIKKVTSLETIAAVDNCLGSSSELYFHRDGIIKVPHNAAHNFGSDQDFTIECRFRSDSPTDVQIVGKKDWDSGLKPGYVFSFKPSTKKFKVNIGDGANRVDIETEEITDNEWHTISATFDRNGMLSVYMDGVFSKSSSMTSIGAIDNNFDLTFGADGNNKYKMEGYVAEVRIFNSLLSADEIDSWTCKTLDNTHPKYTDLKGHWKIDEGSGTSIVDSSPNGFHGVLEGAVWKDATIDKVVEVYNFDGTPRIVDVVNTALTHLCIPIESLWSLDGNSLVQMDCSN